MLKIDNITKIFNAGQITERVALSSLSLQVENGDFITVVGGNGAGKSTLLNCISGVYDVDGGSIVLDGRQLVGLAEYKRAVDVGRVFQDPLMGTAGGMNLEENLALAYRRGQRRGLKWGVTADERKLYHSKLQQLGLGLENRMAQKVSTLSGGQRQSLALLMAVMRKPKLLLLDEHTAALDPKTARKVLELTEELSADDDFMTIMVTHNMNDAIKMGNRLIMMNEGHIIYDVRGEEKKNLRVTDLMEKFEQSGAEMDDRLLLSND